MTVEAPRSVSLYRRRKGSSLIRHKSAISKRGRWERKILVPWVRLWLGDRSAIDGDGSLPVLVISAKLHQRAVHVAPKDNTTVESIGMKCLGESHGRTQTCTRF